MNLTRAVQATVKAIWDSLDMSVRGVWEIPPLFPPSSSTRSPRSTSTGLPRPPFEVRANRSEFDTICYEVADGVALVMLNQPDRGNVWSGPMAVEYRWALHRADTDPRRTRRGPRTGA